MLHPQSKVFPAPPPSHVQPDGIQDEDNEYKEETSHVRSMTDKCTAKAEKPRGPATTRVSQKAVPAAAGTLCRQSVAKLDSTANRMNTALGTMETQLACARKSMYIAPQLISKLAMLKSGLYAEATALNLYKTNNKEDDTGTVIAHAKTKLDSTVQEFNVLKKLLKAEEMSEQEAGQKKMCLNTDVHGSGPDVD